MKHYTIYKITNTINSRYYIGMHVTSDINDGYMGSGKLIKRAIQKYGIDNFTKEILFDFSSFDQMISKEVELITEDVIADSLCYNLNVGGSGSWFHVNNTKTNEQRKRSAVLGRYAANKKGAHIKGSNRHKELCEEDQIYLDTWKQNLRNNHKSKKSDYKFTHTEDTKEHLRSVMKGRYKGKNNPSFGTIWITNGTENKKINRDKIIPNGWNRGRTL